MSECMELKDRKCVTHDNSSGGSGIYDNKTVTISIRIPAWLYDKLKRKGVLNISQFIRKLVEREIEGELDEEERLEADLNDLKVEMERLQEYHSTLLKHGSYAQNYLEKLKDGNIVSHRPFYYSKHSQPTLSGNEQALVTETIRLREQLAKIYAEKLQRLLELKKARINVDFKDASV